MMAYQQIQATELHERRRAHSDELMQKWLNLHKVKTLTRSELERDTLSMVSSSKLELSSVS